MTLNVRKTPMLKRRLQSGDWVYVSEGNKLIVLNNKIAERLNSIESIEESIIEELINSGILTKDLETDMKNEPLKKEPNERVFKAACLIIVFFGLLASILSIVLMFLYGFPFKSAVDSIIDNPVKSVITAISAAMLTTMMHELMHIAFSANELKINFNIKKSIATVSLTHVWTWSLLGRVAAITSGMSFDAIMLLLALYIPFGNSELFSIISAVLITRILWQFRITQKTDLNILFRFLFDHPFLFEDLNERQIFLVKLFSFVVTLSIIATWMLPLINRML